MAMGLKFGVSDHSVDLITLSSGPQSHFIRPSLTLSMERPGSRVHVTCTDVDTDVGIDVSSQARGLRGDTHAGDILDQART